MPNAPVAPPAAARRRVLVVLGMHRGGTSAVAGVLHRLGVDLGPRLMPANADNPSGYYEHNDVVNLHDRFLLRLGAGWDAVFPPAFDPALWNALAPAPGLPTYRDELLALLTRDFPSAPLWGIKDPRLCLLLPWWEPLWAALGSEPYFLIVLRHPDSVAASLERRDGFSPAKARLLWLQHLLRAERFTRGRPRCLVDYDRFLEDWRGSLRPLGTALGAFWSGLTEEDAPSAPSFLSRELRHHSAPPAGNREPGPGGAATWVSAVQQALWELLEGSSEGAFSILDDVWNRLSEAQPLLGSLWVDRRSDARAELLAQRRLTLWYEEEWQKSVRSERELQQRLAKQRAKLDSLRTELARAKQRLESKDDHR